MTERVIRPARPVDTQQMPDWWTAENNFTPIHRYMYPPLAAVLVTSIVSLLTGIWEITAVTIGFALLYLIVVPLLVKQVTLPDYAPEDNR